MLTPRRVLPLLMCSFVLLACGEEGPPDEPGTEEGSIAEPRVGDESSPQGAPGGRESGGPGADRSDLARFVGEYGTPASEERGRTFWVVEHCDGYLVAGAMWGDASPWRLESVSETVFDSRVPEGQPAVRLEFGTDSGGDVESLRVQYDGRPMLEEYPRLERLRETPRGFEEGCWRGRDG